MSHYKHVGVTKSEGQSECVQCLWHFLKVQECIMFVNSKQGGVQKEVPLFWESVVAIWLSTYVWQTYKYYKTFLPGGTFMKDIMKKVTKLPPLLTCSLTCPKKDIQISADWWRTTYTSWFLEQNVANLNTFTTIFLSSLSNG